METDSLEKLINNEQETLFEMASRLQRRTSAELTLRYEKAISGLFAYIATVKEMPTREAYGARLEVTKKEKLAEITDEEVRKKLAQSFDRQKANYEQIFTRDLSRRLLVAMQSYLDFTNTIRNNYALTEEAAIIGARAMRVPGSQHISLNDAETHNEIKNMALLLTDLVIYAEFITPETIVEEVWGKLLSSPRDQQFDSYRLRKEKIIAGKDKNELLRIGERTYNAIKNDDSIAKAQEKVADNNEKDLGGMYG